MTPPDYSQARQPRPPRQFTVLLPVLRPPEMLPYAVRSVLAQSEPDFELCIICDGAPPETAAVARQLATGDPRIHVFAYPKGLRHGETHRAAVLAGARSDFVCHIGDDDLWLPDHLKTLAALLEDADFVSVPGFTVQPDRRLQAGPYGDLAQAFYRNRMLHRRWNFFGPTEAGYRLSAYRQLPEGWAPGPDTLWSDLNMWRKFLRHPGMRFRSGRALSTLKFATPDWTGVSLADRATANALVWDKLQDPTVLAVLRREAALLVARSVKLRRLPRVLFADPSHGLALLRLRLFGGKPTGRPIV